MTDPQTGAAAPPPAPSTSPSELSFLYDLSTAPCFRTSALTGLGGGAAIAALNLHRHSTHPLPAPSPRAPLAPRLLTPSPRLAPTVEDPMRAAETMIKTGCAVSLLSWYVVRANDAAVPNVDQERRVC